MSKKVCAVGIIRANHLHDCPCSTNKDLEKQAKGEFDNQVDSNSGVTVTKWVDNKAVLVGSNYVDLWGGQNVGIRHPILAKTFFIQKLCYHMTKTWEE